MAMHGRLYPIGGDWCEWRQEPPLPATVLVQIRSGDGGRLVLSGLRIDGEPTAELLRAIPIGRIEAAANAQLALVEDAVAAGAVAAPRHIQPPPVPVIVSSGWETTDPGGALARHLGRASHRIRDSARAGGSGRPDAFYQNVARSYLDLAQSSARPALELAAANEIPVSTAHRWVKEARRRGFLPPGRPGKAG